jgi:PPOX class probable FMN-dependent enzyme
MSYHSPTLREETTMPEAAPLNLTTLEQLRAIIDEPNAVVRLKVMESLNQAAIDFIVRSPMMLLGTSDADGQPDVSPKGDHAGFVAIENLKTLLIPDRKGNKLLFSLQNILANPRVALFFMVPGTDETLRVQGRAEMTADPQVLTHLSARGQPALLAIRVHIEKCFFHCAKAFKRSQLWSHESWPTPQKVSFGKMMAERMGGTEAAAKQIDELVERDYKENL